MDFTFQNGFRHFAYGTAVSLLATVAATAAPAQEAGPAADTAMASDDSAEIVVTAQRREQRLTEVPISIQAVSAAALERNVLSSSLEIIQVTPSVKFTGGAGGPGGSGAVMRGVSSNVIEGGIQPSVAVIVDDVPYSRQSEFTAEYGDLDRVEILRGPQGTLFGKNATGGVINFVTKKPTDRFEGSIEGSYATDDEKLIRGVINIPLTDRIRTRLRAYWRDLPPTVPNRAALVDDRVYRGTNAQETYGLSAKTEIDVNDSVLFTFAGDISKLSGTMGALILLRPLSNPANAALQNAAGVVATRNNPFTNQDAPTLSVFKVWGVSGKIEADLSDALKLTSITAYRHYYEDHFNDTDVGPWGGVRGRGLLPNPFNYPFAYIVTGDGGLPRKPDYSSYWSHETRLNYSNDKLDVVGGIFVQKFKNDRTGVGNPFVGRFVAATPTTLYYNDTQVTTHINDDIYSVFADVTYRFSDRLSAFAGARYSREKLEMDYRSLAYFTPNFDPIQLVPLGAPTVKAFTAHGSKNNLSGRAGIRFEVNPDLSFHLSYSRGYKGPALDASRVSTPAHAVLKPEIANAFELGMKSDLMSRRLSINAAIFWQRIKDVQQSAAIPGSILVQLQNAGDLVAYGAELDATARITPAFRIDGNLAYVNSEYRDFVNGCYPGQTAALGCNVAAGAGFVQSLDGKRTQGSPRLAWTLGGTYNLDLGDSAPFDAFINVLYSWTGRIQYGLTNDPLLREPSYGILNATVGFTDQDNRWTLSLFAKNITNKVYYVNQLTADSVAGRQFAILPRDYKRYGGIQLKANF